MRYGDFEDLKKQLISHRVVKWTPDKLVLENGTVLTIEESESDCCAWAGGEFKDVKLDAAITNVEVSEVVEDSFDESGGEASKQLNKLVEELGELAEGFNKNKPEQIKDSLGDMFVVMTIFAKMNGLSLDDCIKEAYNTIKDRDGMMVDGVFVKNSDLAGGHYE